MIVLLHTFSRLYLVPYCAVVINVILFTGLQPIHTYICECLIKGRVSCLHLYQDQNFMVSLDSSFNRFT